MTHFKAIAYLTSLFSFVTVFANIGPAGFNDFRNYYFVETGTSGGNGIAKARQTGLFTEIYSMDLDPKSIQFAQSRFNKDHHVHIVQGDTARDLEALIKPLDKQITFWLDAHVGEPRTDGGKNTPLLEELDQIKSHPIKTHTLLIDDMHCTNTILFDFISKKQIIDKILEINPNYQIEYVNGGDDGEYPDNVMVARVIEKNPKSYLENRLPKGGNRFPTFRECLMLMEERAVRMIVETGTARCGDANFDGDGGSTIIFGHWAKDHKAKMFSVDNNEKHLDIAKTASTPYLENMEFVLQDSVQFLKDFPQQIDLLYLDSYDYDENNPGPLQQHALKEIKAAYDKLGAHSIVMIDGCNIPGGGKGKLAIQFLLENDWTLRANRHQAILVRK